MENLENAIAIHKGLQKEIELLTAAFRKERTQHVKYYEELIEAAIIETNKYESEFKRLQMEVHLASCLNITKEEAIKLKEDWLYCFSKKEERPGPVAILKAERKKS